MTEVELENMAHSRPEDFYKLLANADRYPSYVVVKAISIGARWLSTRQFATFVLKILSTSTDERVQLECVRALKKHAPWRKDVYAGLNALLRVDAGMGVSDFVRRETWIACKNAREMAEAFQNGPKAG